jgi:large subunit ribosomal protein L21e
MVKRLGGFRHKTRYKLQRAAGERGKLRLTARFTTYSEGDRVALIIDPSEQKGIFFPRHHGKTGTVVGKQGGAYLVAIDDKDKAKTIIATPVHLKRIA